ncbi:hypothetical protein Rhe02_26330 [Rhizocola hellebori]|uniref:SMI1/KNR4 family protein n=1 Tax=Rhizocola hellebori TaxID=1392758 RepID=A0A8J3Q788_9ACTN|nr:hypothetical protein [Rhizocola hellebori]GIH04566.1 hypothetical protein Rhe02_26330 [Rhizocola hellebori]
MTLTPAQAQHLLQELGLPFAAGLSETELRHVERLFGFEFNPDHRALLRAGLPLGERWPDWRHPDAQHLKDRLDSPIDGVLFDVAENAFWLHAWGPRPDDADAALAVAKRALNGVPRLIPVYGHRFAPALPEAGLPVLSVVQTDVIVYGRDMTDYLLREFGSGQPETVGSATAVPFWLDLS